MQSLVRTLALLAVLALGAQSLTASQVSFTLGGRVVDGSNGRPLAGTQVYVPGTGIGGLTNADGRYLLIFPDADVIPAEIVVEALLIGYQTATATVNKPRQGQSATVDFRLEATAITLDEVVVSATATPQRRRSLGNAVSTIAAPGQATPRTSSQGSTVQPSAPTPASRHHSAAAPVHHPTWDPNRAGREQYAHIADNSFRGAVDNPLSTFSIDVDRASYSNVRRFLAGEGRLPPIDAVQVEEMINYFPYRYELPNEGDAPIAVTTELGYAPWRDGHQLLRIGVASTPIDFSDAPPSNLVFLLDVSGSMQSPDKLPLVKSSLRLLVEQLRPVDRVAIVVYAGAAGLVLAPTSGAHRHEILEAIERLEAGGSTAGGAGLRLAYDVARRHFQREGNNRVILATDGDFNVGESSDAAMVRLVEDRRREGTFLTVLGFGTGNLQSTKMQEMAQHGNGNYAYIDGLSEARKIFVGEMGGTLLTVASDVKIQVEFNPARVSEYRLIGYENRLLAAEDFNDDLKDAGELGAGHTVTALYEIVPVGAESHRSRATIDPLRYGDENRTSDRDQLEELAYVKVRYKEPGEAESRLVTRAVRARPARTSSDDLVFASAVAMFGMLLRESEHVEHLTADDVEYLAWSSLGEDPRGYRRSFIGLVRAYDRLTDTEYTHHRHR